MSAKPTINVYAGDEKLYAATCRFICDVAVLAIKQRGKFSIALSGGNTPAGVYAMLASPAFIGQIDWNKTFIFWGDERYVPADDDRSNFKMANTQLLGKVNIPAQNIYPVPVQLEPAECALRYERTITEFFKSQQPQFDLILLGLGEDGHTASLFPGTEIVNEQNALVKEVYLPQQKMWRISFTLPLINRARNIAFLVAGRGKADIVERIFNASKNKYPAQLIQPGNGKLFWLLDKSAAGKLKEF